MFVPGDFQHNLAVMQAVFVEGLHPLWSCSATTTTCVLATLLR